MNAYLVSSGWQKVKHELAVAACLGWFLKNSKPHEVALTGSFAIILLLRERSVQFRREARGLDLVAQSVDSISTEVLKHSWLAYKEPKYLALLWQAMSPERVKVNVFTDPHPSADDIVHISLGKNTIPVVSLEFLVAHLIYDCFQIIKTHIDEKEFDDVAFLLKHCKDITLSRTWNKYYLRVTGYEWEKAWSLANAYKVNNPQSLVPDATKQRSVLKSLWWIIKFGLLSVLMRTFNSPRWDSIW